MTNTLLRGEIGPDLFAVACRMGLEGLVSKHRQHAYRGGRCRHWIKGGEPQPCGVEPRVLMAGIFVTLDRTIHGALSKRRRGWWDDQVAGCATPLMISRSAVSGLPLVSGPSSTEITTRTRKSIVLIIIGKAKPKFICTAR